MIIGMGDEKRMSRELNFLLGNIYSSSSSALCKGLIELKLDLVCISLCNSATADDDDLNEKVECPSARHKMREQGVTLAEKGIGIGLECEIGYYSKHGSSTCAATEGGGSKERRNPLGKSC